MDSSRPAFPSSLASTYARLWSVLRRVAGDHEIRPNVVLVTLAVAEGARDTSSLERVLLVHDSVIRRALTDAGLAGLVTGSAVDGGSRRPGVRNAVDLTPKGRKVAVAAVVALEETANLGKGIHGQSQRTAG